MQLRALLPTKTAKRLCQRVIRALPRPLLVEAAPAIAPTAQSEPRDMAPRNRKEELITSLVSRSLTLAGPGRVWLHSLPKSGTTYLHNSLVNYCVALLEENTGTELEVGGWSAFLKERSALRPAVLTSFHSFESRLTGKGLYRALELQKAILKPTLGYEGPIHTHTRVKNPQLARVACRTRNPFDAVVSSYQFHYKDRGVDCAQ